MGSIDSTDDESKDSLLYEQPTSLVEHERNRVLKQWLFLTSCLATIFFLSTIALAVHQIRSPTCIVDTNRRNTYATDFVSAAPGIEVEIIEKHFTNDLRYNTTSQSFYNEVLDPTETRYIGPVGPELDEAWHELLHSQYVAISVEEALQFPEASRQTIDYYGEHSFFELAVYHNLHCLNELRMALDPEYYEKKGMHHDNLGGRVHIDHCIDQLRQAVECQGDLTPVPMLSVEGGPRGLFLGNGELHTCRNFAKIRSWVDERAKLNRALGD